ncbi:hypothetical protein [Streptomyces sp. CC208A]|uniref:hypothetical protein n=1 Tax=Streptomyces sp. CC208A TaxID=3044573 RepID=UPI0024A9CD60|nr:hypothetical protein [Streptomyces sp. CC208A]
MSGTENTKGTKNTGPRHGTPVSARRRRAQNALVGLVGVLALLCGAALLIGVLPRAVTEERAFLSASPCQGNATDDCLRTVWFSVDSVRVQRGKQSNGRVEVSGPEQGSRTVEFSGVGEFLERIRPGDRVMGTLWRGSVVSLSDAEGGQRTAAHPVGGSLFAAGFGIVLVLAGGLGGYAAWWWTRHPDGTPARRPAPLTVAISAAGALGVYAFVLVALLYEREPSLQRFFGLWAPAVLVVTVLLLVRPLRECLRRPFAQRSEEH